MNIDYILNVFQWIPYVWSHMIGRQYFDNILTPRAVAKTVITPVPPAILAAILDF